MGLVGIPPPDKSTNGLSRRCSGLTRMSNMDSPDTFRAAERTLLPFPSVHLLRFVAAERVTDRRPHILRYTVVAELAVEAFHPLDQRPGQANADPPMGTGHYNDHPQLSQVIVATGRHHFSSPVTSPVSPR